jgi:serine-type D-Ala-D-Ala carboxypeptidase (penicillin-binding protein 5/6)
MIRSFFCLSAVAGSLLLLSSCNTTQQASATVPTQAAQPAASAAAPAAGLFSYPNPAGMASGGAAAATGSVQAPQPTPISFNNWGQSNSVAPNITAKAAILIDGSGRVLFEKNADARLPTASTQKLLLGLMVAERGDMSGSITITEPDTWAEPTIIGLRPGEVYNRHSLLKAVLVRSCNDIARTLARDVAGSEAGFVSQVNAKARSLGMTNSYFTNSNGLPSPSGQYSTARDLSRMAMAAYRNPIVRDAISTKAYSFRMANGTVKTLYNTNQVLKNFPFCTGGKTGYTNAAGRCLVSMASNGGKTFYAVILGSTSPTVSVESEALLRYGLGM